MERMVHETVVGLTGFRVSQEKINNELFITSYAKGVILVKNNVEILLTKEELFSIYNSFDAKNSKNK